MKKILAFLMTCLVAIGSWAADAVNVNTATAEEIAEALKGVGQSKAQAIVRYREANGAFKHVDELVNVKGIGLRTVDINREFIMLEGENNLAARKH
jgi:competence protein ComEA